MAHPLPRGIRAPVENLCRVFLKNYLLNEAPPDDEPVAAGRFGHQNVLPPCLGEMGAEIRYHIARVEPWLNNGWKVVTRRPALYPEGTTVAAPEYFSRVDDILRRYQAIGSHGGVHIPPLEHGQIRTSYKFDGTTGEFAISLSEISKVTKQSLAEIELRELFLEWFHFDGRPITEFDRANTSFSTTAVGNWEYHAGVALRPNFLPPAFVNPVEPVAPHVGVQMRDMHVGLKEEPRNSNVARMMHLAETVAAHLGLEVLVYGHPGGCHIPPGAKSSWDPQRADNHMVRELGYLKSCRVMLAPDSGWADLMAWLRVPTLLEQVYAPGAFEPLRLSFGGKLQPIVPNCAIEPQVDALLAAEGTVLPEAPDELFVNAKLYPWEP